MEVAQAWGQSQFVSFLPHTSSLCLCPVPPETQPSLPFSLLPSPSSPRLPLAPPSSSSHAIPPSVSILLLLSLSLALLLFCSRFTISYIYFTLSLKMKDFGVDIYFQQAIPGILEVPARLCCLVLLEHLGRKCSLFLSLILAAIMCLFLLFLPQGTTCKRPPPDLSLLQGLPSVSYLGWPA